MVLKESIYNYNIVYNNKLVLYNRYSGNLLKLDYEKSIENTMKLNYDLLSQKGFLVSTFDKEYEKALMNYYDDVYDNKMLLTLMPTEECNFRCNYCYESFKKGKMSENIVKNIKSYISKHISNYSSLFLSWFGGEPLLALDIIEELSEFIINMSRRSKRNFYASITTNGYLLNAENFKRLLQCKVLHYQVTLDGLQQSHNKFRVLKDGSGTFDKIIANLREIRDEISSKKFKITIRCNITKETINYLSEFIDLMNEEFGNDERFELLFRLVGNWGGEAIKNISNELCLSLENVYNIILSKNITPFLANSFIKSLQPGICYAAKRNQLVIGSDGSLYKCTVKFDLEENQIGFLDEGGNLVINNGNLTNWILPISQVSCPTCNKYPMCRFNICPAQKLQFKSCENYRVHKDEELNYILKIVSYII